MSQETDVPSESIQVCVRVRPLNYRELEEGHRICVHYDDPSKQVVLTAVDKSTLLQLRGATAKGYAFNRCYGRTDTSESIYSDCISQLVENCFKGYNATVLAYGQTGSGKTHTMAGGVGIHGVIEEGVIPRVIRHIFAIADALKKKFKPGENLKISAYALELYNEEIKDLMVEQKSEARGWGGEKSASTGVKLQERPVGKDGRVVPEVVGVTVAEVNTAEELLDVFRECIDHRTVSSTKMNDTSSRSHAIFTITFARTIVEVTNELDGEFRAKVRTSEFESKLHLVDLAGSERVKRSGVTGKEFKEATHINGGLLALGNVIVALAAEGEGKKKGHIPYRDSKLTRLLCDSLGGNSLTVLISCISPSEADFEETNNTLKYANRACSIKNTPLPNKFITLEEDLLPMLPSAGGQFGMLQLQSLLEDHEKMREIRERKEKERKEKEAKKQAALQQLRESILKKPGYQRLRAAQYDELRKQLQSRSGAKSIPVDQAMIVDDTLKGFGNSRSRHESMEFSAGYMRGTQTRPSTASGVRPRTSSRKPDGGPGSGTPVRPKTANPAAKGGRFSDWLTEQNSFDSPGSPSASQLDSFAPEQAFFMPDDNGYGQHSLDSNVIVDDHHHPHAQHHAGPSSSNEPPSLESLQDQRAAAMLAAMEIEEKEAAARKAKFRRAGKAAASARMDSTRVSGMCTGETSSIAENSVFQEPGFEGEEPAAEDVGEEYLMDHNTPRLLARFKVNQHDTLAVFKACTKEDFKDVISLLPENTPLPASDKMTYLLARLEVNRTKPDYATAMPKVGAGELTMNGVVGPAVGCLMATFGTNMISSCIFEFDDPSELEVYSVEERIELWGLQIPHNSMRQMLVAGADLDMLAREVGQDHDTVTWSSVDRLNMSIGLLYALCEYASQNDVRCGFCVPRPQLLKRWLQAGVMMKQITRNLKLIYPSNAHDFEYYKASTVAYFMVDEVQAALQKVLSIVH